MVVNSIDIEVLGENYILERINDSLIIDNKLKSSILIQKNSRSWRVDLDIMHNLNDLLLSGLNGQVFDNRKNTLYYIVNGITLKAPFSVEPEQKMIFAEDGLSYEGDIFNNKIDIYEHLGKILASHNYDKKELNEDVLIERSILIYGEGFTQYFWQSEAKEHRKELSRGDAYIVPIHIADNKTAQIMRLFTLESYVAQFERRMIKDIPQEEIGDSREFEFHVFTTRFLRRYFTDKDNLDFNQGNIVKIGKYMKELSKGMNEFLHDRYRKS